MMSAIKSKRKAVVQLVVAALVIAGAAFLAHEYSEGERDRQWQNNIERIERIEP